jgi:hypothetical protein
MGNNRQPKTRRNAAEALAGAIFPSWPAKRARDERIGVATLPEKRPFFSEKKKRMRAHGHRARKRSDKGGFR